MWPGQHQPAPSYQQPSYQQPPGAQAGPYGAMQGTAQMAAQWFRSIDHDNSGALDATELQKALALGNLIYAHNDVDAMVRAFDQKNSRSLNITEFTKLHEFLTSVTASFAYYDTDRNKSLELNEVAMALRQAGFTLDQPVLQAMCKKYDVSNAGRLKLDDYVRMCLFLQSCVRTFGAFDSSKSGKIALDFNQFVYAASHI